MIEAFIAAGIPLLVIILLVLSFRLLYEYAKELKNIGNDDDGESM